MRVKIIVKPNSDCNCLIKLKEGEYSARIKEPAKDNKANIALIKLLCREFTGNSVCFIY